MPTPPMRGCVPIAIPSSGMAQCTVWHLRTAAPARKKAMRILLLHTAAIDVRDDVSMVCVIGLALVSHKTPKRVPVN